MSHQLRRLPPRRPSSALVISRALGQQPLGVPVAEINGDRPDAVVAATAVLPDLAARLACDHEAQDVAAAEVRQRERTSDLLVAEVRIFVLRRKWVHIPRCDMRERQCQQRSVWIETGVGIA
jgi:hypothetical protein